MCPYYAVLYMQSGGVEQVNRQCSSGLQAVASIANAIRVSPPAQLFTGQLCPARVAYTALPITPSCNPSLPPLLPVQPPPLLYSLMCSFIRVSPQPTFHIHAFTGELFP